MNFIATDHIGKWPFGFYLFVQLRISKILLAWLSYHLLLPLHTEQSGEEFSMVLVAATNKQYKHFPHFNTNKQTKATLDRDKILQTWGCTSDCQTVKLEEFLWNLYGPSETTRTPLKRLEMLWNPYKTFQILQKLIWNLSNPLQPSRTLSKLSETFRNVPEIWIWIRFNPAGLYRSCWIT